jgi:hypothetical protein
MAAAGAVALAGQASAAAITPAAPQALSTLQAGAYGAAGGELGLGVQLFVGGVLLLTAVCFAWLVYLMVTSPPEDDARPAPVEPDEAGVAPAAATLLQLLPGAARQSAADLGLSRSLGQLLRGWLSARIGTRLGHPGPM